MQQLSYYFPDKTMWQSFVCAMTAAVTLQALDPFRSGKLVLYQVTYSTGWHGFEMIPYAILGIFGVCYRTLSLDSFQFLLYLGNLWWVVHQGEHESCSVEESSYVAAWTCDPSNARCITHSSDQLPELLYARTVI